MPIIAWAAFVKTVRLMRFKPEISTTEFSIMTSRTPT